METPVFALYFRHFQNAFSDDNSLKALFIKYGNLLKFFVHSNRQYGIAEFDNMSSCENAISDLHFTQPYNMFVQMAKNQRASQKEAPPAQLSNPALTSFPAQAPSSAQIPPIKQNNFTFTQEDIVYLDKFNKPMEVLYGETGEIYVPLSRVQGVKRVIKKPLLNTEDVDNFENYIFLDDDSSSEHDSYSDRKVKMDDNYQIKIERSFMDDVDSRPNQEYHPRNNFQRPEYRNNFHSKYNNQGQRNYENRNQRNFDNPNENRFQGGNSRFQNRKYDGVNGNGNNRASMNFRRPNTSNNVDFQAEVKEDDWSAPVKENASGIKNNTTLFEEGLMNIQKSSIATSSPILSPSNDKNSLPVEECSGNRKVALSSRATTALNAVDGNALTNKTLPTSAPVDNSTNVSYKTIQLPKGKYTEVKVETKVNNEVGWVRLCDDTSFNEILTKVLVEANSARPIQPKVGILCLAKYEDMWFRAVVLRTTPKLTVRFIDFGNESDDPEGGLRQLSDEISGIPAQCFCIQLADGAPCKIVTAETINVMPVKNENDVIVVHVENGVYDKYQKEAIRETISPVPVQSLSTSNETALSKIQKLTISKIKAGDAGVIMQATTFSKNKFVVSFLPNHFAKYASELTKLTPPKSDSSFKANVGEIVSAKNEEGWNRAYIFDNKKDYKVAFIDYGTVSTVQEIRTLPKEFLDIPMFAYTLTFNSPNYPEEIDDSVNVEVTKVTNNTLTVKLTREGSFIGEENLTIWTPEIATNNSMNQPLLTSKPEIITNQKLTETNLKNNDCVKLVCERQGYLFVRTKQTAEALTRVEKLLSEFVPKAPLQKPEVGQFVACEYDNQWCRILITSILKDKAKVDYVDYGDIETANLSDLKMLSPQLYEESITLIKIKLADFTDKKFNSKEIEFLRNLSEQKCLLKATFKDSAANGVTLITKDGLNISEELIRIEELSQNKIKPNKVDCSISSIIESQKQTIESRSSIKIPGKNDVRARIGPILNLPLGKTKVMYLDDVSFAAKSISVCYNDPKILHKVQVELLAEMTNYGNCIAPQEPHTPIVEESVLARNNGKWYRAVCSEVIDNEVALFFTDYGISKTLTTEDIRRIPVEFNNIPALANFAILEGLPDELSEKLIKRLESLLQKNSVYDVDIVDKQEEDGLYFINFPSILQTLTSEGLI